MTAVAVHVEPLHDLIAHETTGGALCECVCGPDVEFLEGGSVLVSHHSLDGRERAEEHYARIGDE